MKRRKKQDEKVEESPPVPPVAKPVCKQCGGTVHGPTCKLCELFAANSGEGESVPSGHLPSCWPMLSDACAVHPKQIKQANERNRRHGVKVTYNAKGQAVIPDRHERKKLLKLEGFRDRSGTYGD